MENLQYFHEVLEEFPDPKLVLLLDGNLTIHFANTAFFSAFGAQFKTQFGNGLTQAFPQHRREQYVRMISDQIVEHGKFSFELELLDDQGITHTVDVGAALVEYDTSSTVSQLYCTLKIIDRQVNLLHELMREKQLADAVYALSDDLLFRLDIKNHLAQFTGNTIETFGLPPIAPDFPQPLIESPLFFSDDHDALLEMATNMYAGVETPSEFRIYTEDDALMWVRTEYIILRDEDGSPVEAVGRITDVTRQRELERTVSIDSLTGCLTKGAFETLCKEYLHSSSPTAHHALFIVDIDNFKAINDNLGHQFGDIVLKEIGTKLKSLFRDSDYVGRIGGDEFMILARNIPDRPTIERKARELVLAMDNTYEGTGRNYRISGSIGIVTSVHGSRDFLTLYRQADAALYHSKHQGKNSYTFYATVMEKGTMENTTPFDVACRSLSQHFDMEIVTDIFNFLFDAKDFTASVDIALQRLGSRFGAGRCYIFEEFADQSGCSNTYEWCANGIAPQKDQLQNLPADTFGLFLAEANEEGIRYCNDLSELDGESFDMMDAQGIKSFLHAFIGKKNQLRFMVGFDDCTHTRMWSPVEIGTLMYISRILAQFITYKNTLSAITALPAEQLHNIIPKQPPLF